MSLYTKYSDMADQFSPENEVHKALTQMQTVFDEITNSANKYDGSGLQLLSQTSNLLAAFLDINPAIEQITLNFTKAVQAYAECDAKWLDDAFDMHRPPGWNQTKAKRDTQKKVFVVQTVDQLTNLENLPRKLIKTDAFEEIGSNLIPPVSAGTISNMYYDNRDEVYDLVRRKNAIFKRVNFPESDILKIQEEN